MANPGMDYDQLFPNRFLKAGEMKGRDVTLTVAAIAMEKFANEDEGSEENRPIVKFKETPKQWVLNRTNAECLKGMFGRATWEWVGKRVTLCPQNVKAFGEMTLAVRVRGSPDIAEDITVNARLGKKTAKIRLVKTATKQRAPGEDG